MRLDYISGDTSNDVIEVLESVHGLTAFQCLDRCSRAIEKIGFNVANEFRVESRGDLYGGYVDLVAQREQEFLAIELDRRRARKKSIFKIHQVRGATCSMVFCRD